MNPDKVGILPLFPSTTFTAEVDEDMSSLEEIKEKYEFVETVDGHMSHMKHMTNSYITNSHHILDDFPKEKNIIMEYFNQFKIDILRESARYKITTSWGTKVLKNGYSHFHAHSNSIYSGLFFIDDADEDCADFVLTNSLREYNPIITTEPLEKNIYNCDTWNFKPRKNLLIFFPSKIHHKIGLHLSETPRYSIAFNLFPEGEIGFSDSYLNISHT